MKIVFLFLSFLFSANMIVHAQSYDTSYYRNGKISSISYDSIFSNKRFSYDTGFSKSGTVNYIDRSVRNIKPLQIDSRYFSDFEYAFANIGNYSYTKEFYKSGAPKNVSHQGVEKDGEFMFDTTFDRNGRITNLNFTNDSIDNLINLYYFKNNQLKRKWVRNEKTDSNIDSFWNKKGLLYHNSLWDSIFTSSKYYSESFEYYDNGSLYQHIKNIDYDSFDLFWVRNFYISGAIKEEYCTKHRDRRHKALIPNANSLINLDSINHYKEVPNTRYFREYYENGTLKNEYYLDKKDKYDSLFYTYYETGELLGILEYKNNRILNAQYFNKDGSILESGDFKNGNGELVMYENGYIIRKCRFKDGKGKCKCD